MMHTKIATPGLSINDRNLVRVVIGRIDELADRIDALSGLAFELKTGDDLSPTQRGVFNAIEYMAEQLGIEAEAISDALAKVVPGAERVR